MLQRGLVAVGKKLAPCTGEAARRRLSFVLFVAVCTLGGPARAEPPIPVKIGHVGPDGSPWDNAGRKLAQLWTREQPRFRFKVFPASMLGSEEEHVRLCRSGKVQICGLSDFYIGSVIPEVNVLNTPFLFSSEDEADFIVDNVVVPELTRRFRDEGLELYAVAELGWLDLATTRPVHRPEELAGLRIRVPRNPFFAGLVAAFGAIPLQISMTEAISALEVDAVGGMLHTQVFLLGAGWHHRIRHLSETRLSYSTTLFVVHPGFWDALPAKLRDRLRSHVPEIATSTRRESRSLAREVRQSLSQLGVTLYRPSQDELAAFRDTATKQRAAIEAPLGARGRELLRKVRGKLAEYRRGRGSGGTP